MAKIPFKLSFKILVKTTFKIAALFSIMIFDAHAQTSSRGPGKGPPAPGMGSKETYPQPKKVTAIGPDRIEPGAQIPEHPEKSMWKLTNKHFATGANPDDVPVYSFSSFTGGRTLVGQAKVGDEITLEEVRVAARRNHYRFKWSGAPKENLKLGTNPEFWIDGINIEYAGKK